MLTKIDQLRVRTAQEIRIREMQNLCDVVVCTLAKAVALTNEGWEMHEDGIVRKAPGLVFGDRLVCHDLYLERYRYWHKVMVDAIAADLLSKENEQISEALQTV